VSVFAAEGLPLLALHPAVLSHCFPCTGVGAHMPLGELTQFNKPANN